MPTSRWPPQSPETAMRLLVAATVLLCVAGASVAIGQPALASAPVAVLSSSSRMSRFDVEGLYQGALRGVLRKPDGSGTTSARVGDVLLEGAERVAPFTEAATSSLAMYGEPPADKRTKTAPRAAVRVLPPRRRSKTRRDGDERRPDPATGIVDERFTLKGNVPSAAAPNDNAPLVAWGVYLHTIPVLEARLEHSPVLSEAESSSPLRPARAAAEAKLRLTFSCGECHTVIAPAAHASASLGVPPPSDGADATSGASEGSVLLNDPVDPATAPVLHFLGRRHSFAVALLTASSSIRATVRRGVPRDDASAQRTAKDGGWHVVLDGLVADDVDFLFAPGPEPLAAHRQLSVLLGRSGTVPGFMSAVDADVQLEVAEEDAGRVNPAASHDIFRAIVEASDLTGVTAAALHNRTCSFGGPETGSAPADVAGCGRFPHHDNVRTEAAAAPAVAARTRLTASRPSLTADVRRAWDQIVGGNAAAGGAPAAAVGLDVAHVDIVDGRRVALGKLQPGAGHAIIQRGAKASASSAAQMEVDGGHWLTMAHPAIASVAVLGRRSTSALGIPDAAREQLLERVRVVASVARHHPRRAAELFAPLLNESEELELLAADGGDASGAEGQSMYSTQARRDSRIEHLREAGWKNIKSATAAAVGVALGGRGLVGVSTASASGAPFCDEELLARYAQLAAVLPAGRFPAACRHLGPAHAAETAPEIRSTLEFLLAAHNAKDADANSVTSGDEPSGLLAVRYAWRLRQRLLPYMHTAGAIAALRGEPLLRPVAFDFFKNPLWALRAHTMMLGDAVATRPVTESKPIRALITKPVDDQRDRWFAASVDGAAAEMPSDVAEAMVPAGIADVPLFLRGGFVLPFAMERSTSGPRQLTGSSLSVAVLLNGLNASSGYIYMDDGTGPTALLETGRYRLYAVTFGGDDGHGMSVTFTPRDARTIAADAVGADERARIQPPNAAWRAARVVREITLHGVPKAWMHRARVAQGISWNPQKKAAASSDTRSLGKVSVKEGGTVLSVSHVGLVLGGGDAWANHVIHLRRR